MIFRPSMSSHLLRAWVGILGVGTLVAGYRCCFSDDFAKTRFPEALEQVTPLLHRTYVVSSLLTGATRIAYAIDPHSLSLCLSVMLSFVLAFCHLWLEVDIESLSDVRLIVIVVTVLWMTVSWLLGGSLQKDFKTYHQSTFVKLLRFWVGLVGIIAMINGIQCHMDGTFSARRIYTLIPEQATQLSTRTFGSWTILAGVLRAAWALSPHTISVYLLVVLSFILAFIHFIVETAVTSTAPYAFSTISPLIISSGSTLMMLTVWPSLRHHAPTKKKLS